MRQGKTSVLIIAELFSEVVTVSQPVPGEEETDTAEQLELMRSAFRVIRTVREKHACTQCDAIVQAPAPSRPIERGIAGPGLLARVLTSKYAEHTPLYCQSEIYGTGKVWS